MNTQGGRIMVAGDGPGGLRTALAKAEQLRPAGGLLLVQTCYDPLAEEPAEILAPERRQRLVNALTAAAAEELDALASSRPDGPAVETRVVWAKDTAAAILEEAARWGPSLLVKPLSRDHDGTGFLHMPLDWALMREAPSPVLLSRDMPWQSHAVLAAVDAADRYHDGLNREIIRRAAGLARELGGPLHVASAYPDLGQSVNPLQVADDFRGIKADMKRGRHERIGSLLQGLDLAGGAIHVLEGPPGRVIPTLSRRLDAAVTVLGTAARHGLGKLVMGNTAEDLVGRLPGDMLTVRASWS